MYVTWRECVCHNSWACEQLELLFSLGRTLVQGLGLGVDAVDEHLATARAVLAQLLQCGVALVVNGSGG
jgi:hypothetical protein